MEYSEEIYKLREEGLSFKEIEERLKDKGIDIPWIIIRNMCKVIYKEKKKDFISDDEIFKLREQGLSYYEIAQRFKDNGINVCSQTINNRCKKIYEEKGMEEPKCFKRKKFIRRKVSEDEIYELREKGLSYREIEKRFEDNGIEISFETIRVRCKNIYKQNGEEEIRIKISEDEIYNLRNQGLSYSEIAKQYNDKGINVSSGTIRLRCKKIYKEKGEEEPFSQYLKVSEEEIFKLREQGISYQEIVEYFKDNGIDVSWFTIRSRCKKIYKEKGKQEIDARRLPKNKININAIDDKEKVRKNLLKLKETRNATDEQLAKIAECYGIDIDEKQMEEK